MVDLDIDSIKELEVTLKSGESFVYKGNGLIKFKKEFIESNGGGGGGVIAKTMSIGSGRYHTTDLSYEVSAGSVFDAAEKMKKQSGLKF